MSFIKMCVVMLIASALTGCNEKLSYDYLMQHPDVLQQEVERCESQSMIGNSSEQIAHCQIVSKAAMNIMTLIRAQQEDPQEFGQKVLDLQMAITKTKQELAEAQRKVDALKAKIASSQELEEANKALTQAQNNYQIQDDEIKSMLAVIGLTSPK